MIKEKMARDFICFGRWKVLHYSHQATLIAPSVLGPQRSWQEQEELGKQQKPGKTTGRARRKMEQSLRSGMEKELEKLQPP